ncbi:MAG: PIG-L family deacetylase [Verrucomicrobia bacterium]|nr:PIG-L family deacetylase [Verrucomicrobiota bacterium]
MHLRTVAVLLAWASICVSALAQPTTPVKQGAALLKTDIIGVFAHPDDETGMAATLARYALGQTSIVANVYCTRGEGGGNMVGTQSGAALGALREAELRDCLTTLGVRYCYFLDQLDWAYTESVAATLEKWGKEQTLERLVRLVRALRPEIIVTMNPAPTPGQHGHHQAAGVLATEAFAAAADPKRFPLQLSKEGLSVWQPRRLFFSGGSGEVIATIPVNEPLADGRIPGQIAATALANHRSQAFGNFGNSPWLQRPQRFTLVKSFAPVSGVETNLLAGLPLQAPAIAAVEFAKRVPTADVVLEFAPRPAFANYRRWVREHRLEHVAAQIQGDIPVVAGEANVVRLEVANSSDRPLKGDLALTLPTGWTAQPASRSVTVAARAKTTIEVKVTPPAGRPADTDLLATWSAEGERFEAKAKLHPLPKAAVSRVKSSPAMDGSDLGWEKATSISVAATNLVQGKVADAADSSAIVRVAHDGKTIFVDVEVKDDVVVTNIEPNDIKGHWRSDSVELCFDPAAGAEHTMGCYKLGIFPFDTTGVVRAARDADANQGLVEETAPKTRLNSIRTVDGYRVQAAIPFDEIGLKRGQRRLGFNVIVYDGDKRDAALGENINKSRIAWSTRSGVQGRPEDWGRIDLE